VFFCTIGDMSVWSVMIIVHATSAVVGFAAGVALLSLRRARTHTWLMPTLLAALVGMTIGNVAATTSHWNNISSPDRIIFSGLAILALYMLYRGWRAQQALAQPKTPPKYTNHIGFILIALIEGLVLVVFPDLDVPHWLTAVVAVLSLIWGIRVVRVAKLRNLALDIEK